MSKRRRGDVNPKTATKHLQKLVIKYNNICQFCFKVIPPGRATREHIKRLADGGIKGLDNVTLACMECNWANQVVQALIAEVPNQIQECIARQAKGLPIAAKGSGNPRHMAPTFPEMIKKQIIATIIRQQLGRPVVGHTPQYLDCSSTQTKKER